MKIRVEIPKFDYHFENYWFYRRGGYKIDKRTWEGKQDIKTAKEMDKNKAAIISEEYDLHPALVYTSIKTRRDLFTFEFLN